MRGSVYKSSYLKSKSPAAGQTNTVYTICLSGKQRKILILTLKKTKQGSRRYRMQLYHAEHKDP